MNIRETELQKKKENVLSKNQVLILKVQKSCPKIFSNNEMLSLVKWNMKVANIAEKMHIPH